MAQHTLLVQRLVLEAGHHEMALVALHHDSHEACLCDIPQARFSPTATALYEMSHTNFGERPFHALGSIGAGLTSAIPILD